MYAIHSMEHIRLYTDPPTLRQSRWCCRVEPGRAESPQVGAWPRSFAASSGAPSAGQDREPGGRQTHSPVREPWDRANHRIDWRPAKGAFFYFGGPPNGRKSALGRAVGKDVGSGPRALASLSPWATGLPPSGLVSPPSGRVPGLVRPRLWMSPRVRRSKHPHKGRQGQQRHQGQKKDAETGSFLSLTSLLSLLSLFGISSTQSPGRW